MESSRGGPLTTFITMLPLIVVPTVAMLKPVGQNGFLSSFAQATTDSDAAAVDAEMDTDSFAEAVFKEVPSSADDFFNEATSDSSDDFASLDAELFAEASGSLAGNSATFQSRPSSPSDLSGSRTTANSNTTELVGQLKRLGARKTLWFSPGPGLYGFVAFFNTDGGVISYRFEAIASSEMDAIRDVIQQALDWKSGAK